MVLDESGSIGFDNFQKIKRFVSDIISRFSVAPFGAHFAVVKYSTYVREVFSLTKYTNAPQLQTAVQNMNYRRGWTNTGKALDFVRNNVTFLLFTFLFSKPFLRRFSTIAEFLTENALLLLNLDRRLISSNRMLF